MILKNVSAILVAATLGVGVPYALVHSMPEHQVEYSVTGKCKKVEYKGQIIPGGCRQVAKGMIKVYTVVQGY